MAEVNLACEASFSSKEKKEEEVSEKLAEGGENFAWLNSHLSPATHNEQPTNATVWHTASCASFPFTRTSFECEVQHVQ
jgi:hypothetical protein